MIAKRKPTGYVATCRCGEIVGAIDLTRTPRKEASFILGQWVANGCTLTPRFNETWSAWTVGCKCIQPTEHGES